MKTRVGLLFAVRLEGGMFGFGQVVARHRATWFMVAYSVVKDRPQLECSEIKELEILFGGNYFDSRIASGHWVTLGVCDASPRVCFPKFKVLQDGVWQVISWDRAAMRLATPNEVAMLEFRTDSSAPVFEDGLNHYLGRVLLADSLVLTPWERTCAAASIDMDV